MSQANEQTTASDVTISELLGAVKGFLMDSALPALSGRDQFNARVAANVLGIIDGNNKWARSWQRWMPPPRSNGSRVTQGQAPRRSNCPGRSQREKSMLAATFLSTSSSGNFWSPRSITPAMPVAKWRRKGGGVSRENI